MKKHIRTMAILAAVAATALSVQADERSGPRQLERGTTNPQCLACDRARARNTAHLRRHQQRVEAGVARREYRRVQHPIARRFDINRDGRLSRAERVAMKSYREALACDRGGPRNRPNARRSFAE